MVEIVYHYCSPSVFLSLIKHKQLWLTSLSQSNDHLEGTWMLRHWLNLFMHSKDAKKRLERRGAQIAVETVLSHNVAIGTCFSEDGDLLSQWRGYAVDGTGFSVGFDKEGLEKIASLPERSPYLSMAKVSYGYQDIKQVNDVVRILHAAFGDDAKKYQEGSNGIGSMSLEFTPEKHEAQKAAARSLFKVKNGAFAEEKEWRLFTFESVKKVEGVEFRESRGILSPFIKIDIPVDLIRCVWLGPTNKTSQPIIEEALKVSDIDCPVYTSHASYRGS
jgi:hypothetical protein